MYDIIEAIKWIEGQTSSDEVKTEMTNKHFQYTFRVQGKSAV